MIKKFLAVVLMSVLSGICIKAEMNYLHISTADGWEVIDLDKADKLTFKGGNMNVLDNRGAVIKTFPQSSIGMMYVNQTAGVGEISMQPAEASFELIDDAHIVKLLAPGDFEVFSLDGRRILLIEGVEKGKTIDISALASGTYVLSLGGYVVKCIL